MNKKFRKGIFDTNFSSGDVSRIPIFISKFNNKFLFSGLTSSKFPLD